MKIVFPELGNPIVAQAVQALPGVEPVLARGLSEAGEMLKNESIISGSVGIIFPTPGKTAEYDF